jgi:RNA polymerase sigma factor (sigma-70 family)
MVSVARSWMTIEQRRGVTFDDLFLAEYGRVVAIARRVLGDEPEAEDVAQDVFCSFYRKHPADAPFAAAWLHRAAAHAALNVIRERKRRRTRETGDALARTRLDAATEADLDPQVALATQEQRAELRTALARLSEKSASVLALRYSGLSYAEVAAALGVNIGQVGTLLRRAEAALKKEMIDATPR